jgi:hypothetical protein
MDWGGVCPRGLLTAIREGGRGPGFVRCLSRVIRVISAMSAVSPLYPQRTDIIS